MLSTKITTINRILKFEITICKTVLRSVSGNRHRASLCPSKGLKRKGR